MNAKMGGDGAPVASSPGSVVDFTRSIPPLPDIFAERLAQSLARLALDPSLAAMVRTAVPGGTLRDRAAGAAWMAPRFADALDPGRVVVTNGTQSAVMMLLQAFAGHGGTVLAEALSYGVIRALADRVGVRLVGAAIDDDGLVPESVDDLCRRERPRAIYCNPSYHNPTTSIMPEERRRAIGEIARHHGIPVIEDDPLGRVLGGGPLSIAAFAPDVTWYVAGMTKSLAQGMRVAYLVGPSSEAVADLVAPVSRLSHWVPAPIQAAIVTAWIEEGVADEIGVAIREETAARELAARRLLGSLGLVSKPASLHVWLPLTAHHPQRVVAARLKELNVLVRGAEMFAVDYAPCLNAIRLSLSSPRSREEVERGLATVAAVLREHNSRGSRDG